MNSEALCALAKEELEEMKASDIQVMDVRELTSITDYMIICTARSTRHARSTADSVLRKAKNHKIKNIHIEGEKDGDWILVDLGGVVAHIMLADSRTFYSLEDLWQPLKDLRESNPSE